MPSLLWFAISILSAADPITIDGLPNEAIWKTAQPQPFAPSNGGDLRIVVQGRYIFVAVTIPEPDGRFTARSVGRNPHWEEEDMVRIVAGAYPDFEVKVSPLGAYSIETKGVVVENERFFAAARTAPNQWTAEIAIPLHDLKATRPGEIRLTAERIRAPRPGTPELRWRYPALGVSAALPPGETDAPNPIFRPQWLGNKDPALQIGRATLPAQDATWQDAAWRNVQPWKLSLNEPMPRPPLHAAEVKALHDGRSIAVLARLADPTPNESFEIYLATTGSSYAWYSIDRKGDLQDASGHTGGQRIARPHPEWNSGATAAVHNDANAWYARIDIPLEAASQVLGESKPPSEWRVLFVRRRPGETSVLPVLHTDVFTAAVRYRALTLTDRATATPMPELPPRLDTRVLSGQSGMLDRYFRQRTAAILEDERKQWSNVNTRTDWESFRDPRIQALKTSLGTFPAKVPLQVQVTREYSGDGYRRQNLVYQSRPGLWVTANLYLPAKPANRMPAFIIIHSHHRPRTQGELQDMGILWARAGAAVLIPDQMGAGERLQNYPWNREAYHSRYVMGTQLHLIGESLISWMVWDNMRAVDLLFERTDIDRDRIILLGAVAGGGDPAGVTAAVDPRISAVAPYNFGESTPESPRFMPERNRWPHELADPGWGSWETTRNLRGSIAGQFFPWLICASVAPRRFIYSFEMGWNVEDLPAWKRYRKVYSLYNALDNLDESHGFGPFPGPGECTNIGSAQRSSLYPELQRWFNIAPPAKEPEERRPESELLSLTPALATKLKMQPVHQLALTIAKSKSRKFDLTALKAKLGDIEPNANPQAASQWKRSVLNVDTEGIVLTTEPGIAVPLVMLRPANAKAIVIVVAQSGKDRTLYHRRTEIESLLKAGIAVCLPDVRGTGETAPDARRGPNSSAMSLNATAQMLGTTLIGGQLKDLRTIVRYLAKMEAMPIAIWGDSQAPVNPQRIPMDELTNWQIGPQPQFQAEPLGGLLATLASLYEPTITATAIHRGLASYTSILESPFSYVPADATIPGILEVADLSDLYNALKPRPLLMAEMIDGRNRPVSPSSDPAAWLIRRLTQ